MAKVTGGAASKLSKIKVVRKNVARVLTALNTKTKTDMRKQVLKKQAKGDLTKKGESMKYKPKQLREKKTRALRRAMKPSEVRRGGGTRSCVFRVVGGVSSSPSSRCYYSTPPITEEREDGARLEEGGQLPCTEIRREGIDPRPLEFDATTVLITQRSLESHLEHLCTLPPI